MLSLNPDSRAPHSGCTRGCPTWKPQGWEDLETPVSTHMETGTQWEPDLSKDTHWEHVALSCVCGGEGLGYLFVGVSGSSKVHQSRIPTALVPLPTITLCVTASRTLTPPLNSPGSVAGRQGPGLWARWPWPAPC